MGVEYYLVCREKKQFICLHKWCPQRWPGQAGFQGVVDPAEEDSDFFDAGPVIEAFMADAHLQRIELVGDFTNDKDYDRFEDVGGKYLSLTTPRQPARPSDGEVRYNGPSTA